MRTIRSRITLAAAAIAVLAFGPFASAAEVRGDGADTTRAPAPDTLARPAGSDTLRPPAPTDTLRARLPAAAPRGVPGADTLRPVPREGVWRMDDLKRILRTETGTGKVYRERKSGRVAMLCALVFPGLGQIYNEKPLKAAIAMGVETTYLLEIAQNRRLREREKDKRDTFPVGSYQWKYHDAYVTEYWDKSVDWIWWSAGALFVIIVDAYVDAHLDDMRFRVEPAVSPDAAGVQLVVRI